MCQGQGYGLSFIEGAFYLLGADRFNKLHYLT